MHSLIDPKTVEAIRATGGIRDDMPDRVSILEAHGLPYDRPAENVVLTGCQVLPTLPHVLASLSRLLARGGLSHTYLSREYCCGNTLYRPAIAARDDEALAECRELSREFAASNLEQMRALGARRLVVFCSPCYPIYRHAFPGEDIVFYPQAIAEVMGDAEWDQPIDYYAGCYRLHRKFAPVPMDLASVEAVFAKVRGLDVHRISAPRCCFDPEGLAHMVGKVANRLMVHVCTGCYGQAAAHLPAEKEVEILMLPEFVERTVGGIDH